jgi:glycosyltransferase involved in cell wall biosynthesis
VTEQAAPTRRVLLVCGPAAGGMRRHLEALAAGLPARGYQVAVAAPAAVSVAAPVPRFGLELGDRPRPVSDLGALRALRRWVSEWQPDLVHAHGVKAALLTLAALPSGRTPVVVTFHNLWHGGPLTLPLRLLAPGAASAIAVSSAVRDRLAAYGVRPKELVVIPNGLDLSAFLPAPPHPREQPFTAAFLGRLTEEKGVRVLLEAARRCSDPTDPTDRSSRTSNTEHPLPDVRFLVAGDGPLRGEVEVEASRPGSRLEYLGHQEDVWPIYHQADAVLMPSLAEGHPMTALEAMACSLPLAASRAGGLPEIVVEGETGVLVPPGDAGALVEAVAALAADRERAGAMGAAGRRRVEAEFTLERMLEGTVDVYRRVLD